MFEVYQSKKFDIKVLFHIVFLFPLGDFVLGTQTSNKPFEMFKVNYSSQKQFKTHCHSTINRVENGFPKGQKYTVPTEEKRANHMTAKVNVYKCSVV